LALALSTTRMPQQSDKTSDAYKNQVKANDRFVLFISSHPQSTVIQASAR
jgi:hypothetical protein